MATNHSRAARKSEHCQVLPSAHLLTPCSIQTLILVSRVDTAVMVHRGPPVMTVLTLFPWMGFSLFVSAGIACGGSASGSGGRRGATGARDSVLPKQDQALAGREGGVNVGSDLAASVNGRKAYTGPGRKLIMGFDVGTTYSGVAYSILENGKVPEIRTVTRRGIPLPT
jgi:hypothetical protein